jgi:transposase
VVNGILWILRTGAPWADLPERYSPYQTCLRRYQRWVREGMCERILEAQPTDLKEPGDLLPMFGPRIARDGARLLIARRRTMGVLALGSNGSKQARRAAHHTAATLINSGFSGQVGQESNLQPAVLEPAAVRSGTFTEVHDGAKNGSF